MDNSTILSLSVTRSPKRNESFRGITASLKNVVKHEETKRKEKKKKTVDGTSITTEMQLILFLKLQRLSPMIAVKFKKGGTVSQLEQKYALMECEYYH